jgi:hypothetical protein
MIVYFLLDLVLVLDMVQGVELLAHRFHDISHLQVIGM